MIHFTLRGGLANMMFQIAAVKSIAMDNNTDCSFHSLDNHLTYLNQHRHLNRRMGDAFEYKKLNFIKDLRTDPLPQNVIPYYYPFHYEHKELIGEEIGLDGFFQSEKYFKNNEKEIRFLFRPTDEIVETIKERYSDLLTYRTTSIHVRRGDYLNHPNHHPVQTLDYYRQALSLTKDVTDKYVIFSDDVAWCKSVFIGDEFIFIENEKDYIELYLMSMCNNNIIANSSFSWWGAWLNNHQDKIVVGPINWFGIAYRTWNTNDVLPNEWIKI